MNTPPDKIVLPAYVSFSSLIAFLNNLRDEGLPNRIDRSLLPKASGSQVSSMLASLRFLKLTDDAGKPTAAMDAVVHAQDEARQPILEKVIREAYFFLFNDPEFNLERASGQQVAEKFRELNISGSTVTKCIAFFLAAAKETNIKVSSHVKPPPTQPRGGNKKVARKKDLVQQATPESMGEEDEPAPDTMQFQIPIPGKSSVKVIVPVDLDAEDWSMLTSMLTAYINRWKNFGNA